MKSFKALILTLVFIMSMTICIEANASDRIGVLLVSLTDEDVNISSMSNYKIYQKLTARYKEMLVNSLTKMGDFEVIKLDDKEFTSLIQDKYSFLYNNKSSTSSSKNGEYIPHYSPSAKRARERQMRKHTPQDTKALLEINAKARAEIGKKYNCKYVIDALIMCDAHSPEGVLATAHLSLYDTDKLEGIATVHSHGEGTAKKAADNSKKSSKKAKKSSDNAIQAAKEQAVTASLKEAIKNIYDKLTGNVAKIASIQGNSIIIDKGASSNMEIGASYLVKAQIHDSIDEVFGTSQEAEKIINLAIIRVKDVQADSSIAEIVDNGGNINAIRVDDMLDPIMKSEVNKYLAQISEGTLAPFPTVHPETVKVEVKSSVNKTNTKLSQSENVKNPAAVEKLPELPPGVMRIGIINFDSKTDEISEAEASTFTDLLSRILSNSDKIAVLERNRLEAIANEQKLSLAGIVDPQTAAQIGKLASCQYILLGSVTGFEDNDTISGQYIRPTERADYASLYKPGRMSRGTAGVLLGLEILGAIVEADNARKENIVTETYEVITNIDVRLVNVQTSQIVTSFTEQGSAAESNTVTQDGNGNLKGSNINTGSIENRSIASAAANIGYRIREFLTGEKIQISYANDGEIIINRGSSSGVQTGDLFCVYSEGQSGGDTEAIISVKDVQEKFSTAEIAKSIATSYSTTPGSTLEPVLHSDFQKGIWHIKNKKRAQAIEKSKQNISLDDLSGNSGKKRWLENSSTEAKKVIKSYRLEASKEKMLINAHSKAAKLSNAKKKYEAYKRLSEADINDYLAAYNTARYALEQSMYIEAREWALKALFINPDYNPAKALIAKIDTGK